MSANATRQRQVRIGPELEQEARKGAGLENLDFATLVRAGLFLLAGHTVADAVAKAVAAGKPGPKPRK